MGKILFQTEHFDNKYRIMDMTSSFITTEPPWRKIFLQWANIESDDWFDVPFEDEIWDHVLKAAAIKLADGFNSKEL